MRVTPPRVARAVYAVTAAAVFVGIAVQLQVSYELQGTMFTSTSSRLFNVFCYFTVQSNVLVGITTALLALRPDRDSTMFRVFRLVGVLGITVTGLVFHLALADLQDLEGAARTADTLLHTVVPVLAVGGWLAVGPRELTSWRVAGLAVLFPLCWCVFALVRGALIEFYAYPFIDVVDLGYARVLLNCLLVATLFFALAGLAVVTDRRLPGLRPRPVVAPSR